MPIKRTPPQRIGITEVPGRVSVELGDLNPDGSRAVTAEEETALHELLAQKRPTTFDDFAGPTEKRARRIVEKHGGVYGAKMPSKVTPGETWHAEAGYLVPGHVEEASELDYALEVLWLLLFARSNDIDEARRYAWMAGLHAQEAHMKFKWEPDALRGERMRRGGSKGAGVVNVARKEKAAEKRERWLAIARKLDPGLSRYAAAKIIAERCGEKLETVRRGLPKKPW